MRTRIGMGIFPLETIGALAAAVVIGAMITGTAAEARHQSQHELASPTATTADHPAGAEGPAMIITRQQMMEENSAADARLQLLVQNMNAAKGQAKVDAMAAVVLELVDQRATMRTKMGQMSRMPRVMGSMPGAVPDKHQIPEQCPMMKSSAEPSKP